MQCTVKNNSYKGLLIFGNRPKGFPDYPSKQNPKLLSMHNRQWNRDEIILALDLYFSPTRGSIEAKNPNIIDLSRLLNSLPRYYNKPDEEKIRIPSSIALKLLNFLPFDPKYAGKRLLNCSKLDQEIFNEFQNKKRKLKATAFKIKQIIWDEELKQRIIMPEIPQIISDIKIINAELLSKVQRNPQLIYSMTPRQFEEFVAELFEKDGYRVSLTQQTRDGGKDLLIVENRRMGKFIFYVECKKYSPNYPIGVRLVRELYGTVMADRVTAGLLITSSYFSNEAKTFTEKIQNQMSLMEFKDLKTWIADLSQKSDY